MCSQNSCRTRCLSASFILTFLHRCVEGWASFCGYCGSIHVTEAFANRFTSNSFQRKAEIVHEIPQLAKTINFTTANLFLNEVLSLTICTPLKRKTNWRRQQDKIKARRIISSENLILTFWSSEDTKKRKSLFFLCWYIPKPKNG